MAIVTERLMLRLPVESDRARLVELFCDPEAMVFSSGVCDETAAERRFDAMLARADEAPFAKQPVIERHSGRIVGYAGADRYRLDGTDWWEWGYRLEPTARGKGYATEASVALLELARRHHDGQLLAMIAPTNLPSQRVIAKLGFEFWKSAIVEGDSTNLYLLGDP